MKKNELIKLLQSINGNPEVKFWNGFVEDVQDISGELSVDYVTKHTRKDYIDLIQFEGQRTRRDFSYTIPDNELELIHKEYDKMKYEYNQYHDLDKMKKKRILILSPKSSGKTTHDRLGTIEY